MTKRSPILGYNHNVRYRGLVFHVQTEDSGVLSPHLFTHLFHGGVIVSTRKLVYDAGSNEEGIKSLMQSQHKVVMKELRRGAFDDKIDQYLGGTPGLEPRGAESAGSVDSAPIAVPITPSPAIDSSPIEFDSSPMAIASAPTQQDVRSTSEQGRPSPPLMPPLPMEDDSPTLQGDDALELVAALPPPPQPQPRANTPPPIPARASAAKAPPSRPGVPIAQEPAVSSSPEIQVRFHDDDRSSRIKALREDASAPAVAQAPPRPASHGAASLPPVTRPPTRPSITPPAVVSRQLTPPRVSPAADGRPVDAVDDNESDAIEVYAPPPASASPPPGERAERPGQYSVSRAKRTTENIPLRESTGRTAAVPAGLMPPGRSGPIRGKPPTAPPPTKPGSGPNPVAQASKSPSGPNPIVPAAAATRAPQVTAPIATRATGTPSNVVMARPAVIVGAPPKPALTQQRVRKAHEDEGRGFGQGLISEKSLDEVILAYLSEDAENDK